MIVEGGAVGAALNIERTGAEDALGPFVVGPGCECHGSADAEDDAAGEDGFEFARTRGGGQGDSSLFLGALAPDHNGMKRGMIS